MKQLKKYQKQIFAFITIFVLLEFGIFPALTSASTISNILGGIGLLLLVVWGVLEIYDVLRDERNIFDDDEFEQKDQFQIRAGIKGDRPKQSMHPEIAKEIAESWRGKLGGEDPLADIPMSRVSAEAKKKMAEIAKKDIQKKLTENQVEFKKINNILSDKTKK